MAPERDYFSNDFRKVPLRSGGLRTIDMTEILACCCPVKAYLCGTEHISKSCLGEECDTNGYKNTKGEF